MSVSTWKGSNAVPRAGAREEDMDTWARRRSVGEVPPLAADTVDSGCNIAIIVTIIKF
jgi:hypothetical protein